MHVCPTQEPSRHQAVLGTAFVTLAVFVALYVLVYVECLVRQWLRASALLIWACLVTLGYVLVFDSWTKEACAWEQVIGWGAQRPWGLGAASQLSLSPAGVHPVTPALSGIRSLLDTGLPWVCQPRPFFRLCGPWVKRVLG